MGLAVWTRELFQCWGLAEKDDRAARPDECVFCKKIAEADPNAFVYQDAELVVFKDWKPAARQHLLVVPRKHITSARVLTGEDAGLARRMLEVGKKVVGGGAAEKSENETTSGENTTRFGYHLPPFNSVDHLHMHAFQLPFDPEWKERKYSVEQWARFAFVPAGETCERLEKRAQEAGANSKL